MVLVLGDQNYYGRFGFDTMLAEGVEVAWAGPYFAGRSLTDVTPPRGKATYPVAFADLD
jgi:predicted N-acetyltransferase YhbS